MEKEIVKLIHLHKNTDRVADELIKRWHRGALSNYEAQTTATFLFNAGYYPSLFNELLFQLEKDAYIPWGVFFKAFEKISSMKFKKSWTIDNELIAQLFLIAEANDCIDDLMRCPFLIETSPKLREFKKNFISEQYDKQTYDKEKALRHLESLKRNQLHDQEKIQLLKIQNKWGENKQLQKYEEELIKRKAVATVQKFKPINNGKKLSFRLPKEEAKTIEEFAAEASIGNQFIELAKSNRNSAYNIAVNLHMMELDKLALLALEYATEEVSTYWLRLELLLSSRRFIDALETLDILEKEYGQEPEIAFACRYMKAQAWWGLAEKDKAIDCMENLLRFRPNYRSASTMLNKWKRTES